MSASISAQSSLFSELDSGTIYEQPLTERARSCLRLEHLFQAIADGLAGDSAWHARAALAAMLEISDLLSRSDIKGELIKELERHATTLAALRDNPGVDQNTLHETVATLSPLIATLKASACQPGLRLRTDELVSQFRQRLAIPGGTCNFDLPAFHFWLNKTARERQSQLNEWLADLKIIERGVDAILRLLRDSTTPETMTAANGFFQQQLDPASGCQLVRVVVAADAQVFPEISGGKHRFTIRFLRQPDTTGRPSQIEKDVSFELQCCRL